MLLDRLFATKSNKVKLYLPLRVELMLELRNHSIEQFERDEVFVRNLHFLNFILLLVCFLTFRCPELDPFSVAILVITHRNLAYVLRHLCKEFLFHLLLQVTFLYLQQNLQYDVVVSLTVLHFYDQIRNAKEVEEDFFDHTIGSYLLHEVTNHAIVILVAALILVSNRIELPNL